MFLELGAKFVYLSGAVCRVVSETGELLRIRTAFWACGRGEHGGGGVAGPDERHVIGSEDGHEQDTNARPSRTVSTSWELLPVYLALLA